MIFDGFKRKLTKSVSPNKLVDEILTFIDLAYKGEVDSFSEISYLNNNKAIYKLWVKFLEADLKRALEPYDLEKQRSNIRRNYINNTRKYDVHAARTFCPEISKKEKDIIYGGKSLDPMHILFPWLNIRIYEVILSAYFDDSSLASIVSHYIDFIDLRGYVTAKNIIRHKSIGEEVACDQIASASLASSALEKYTKVLIESMENYDQSISWSSDETNDSSWPLKSFNIPVFDPLNEAVLDQAAVVLWSFSESYFLEDSAKKNIELSCAIIMDICTCVFLMEHYSKVKPSKELIEKLCRKVLDFFERASNKILFGNKLKEKLSEEIIYYQMKIDLLDDNLPFVAKNLLMLSDLGSIPFLNPSQRETVFILAKYLVSFNLIEVGTISNGRGVIRRDFLENHLMYIEREKKLISSLNWVFT